MSGELYLMDNDFFSSLTIDVEDWFHILDCSAAPKISTWDDLESRVEANLEELLDLLDEYKVKATMFWLGWVAERHPQLLLKCFKAGHEIASHGYMHQLVFDQSTNEFKEDIFKSKSILEDITGGEIWGVRVPGFSITDKTMWALDVIKDVGYRYDSSIFPAPRGHGGLVGSEMSPHWLKLQPGSLLEFPVSVVPVAGKNICLFGGGYLRLAPKFLIHWGIKCLQKSHRPLIVYVHPREIDIDQPRLQLPMNRKFKYYVNLESTRPKLEWLLQNYHFKTIRSVAETAYDGVELSGEVNK